MPEIAERNFGIGPKSVAYGFLYATFGLGAALGAVTVGTVLAKAATLGVVESDHDLVRLGGKANFRTLGKRYGKDTPRAAAVVSQLTADQLRALERGEPVRVGEDVGEGALGIGVGQLVEPVDRDQDAVDPDDRP